MNLSDKLAITTIKERSKRNLSQERLGALAGLPRTAICRLEYHTNSPKLSTIEKVAKAFGMPTSELIAQAEMEEP